MLKQEGTCSNRCALKDYNLNNKRPTVSVDILLAFSCVLRGKKHGFLSGWIRASKHALIPDQILFVFEVQTQDNIYGGSCTVCFA